jgi:alpha-L-rhamnosidase
MILEYTFAGDEDYVGYSPRCTFFGYRFVSITVTAPVKIKAISSIPVTSVKAEHETGRITTGNEDVNRLISNTIWGMNSNYLSVPTDCPQRNERLGWTADTQVFAETGSFFANTTDFFHKWMRDMRDSQSERGGFPSVAPFAQYGNETMRLGWADAGVIVPWIIWKQFGDVSIIEENWDAMVRFMNLVNDTKYDHNALLDENRGYQYADWLSYESLESHGRSAFFDNDKGKPRPETIEYWNYLSASYWAIDAGLMSEMAAATGRDAKVFEAMETAAKDYLRATFFDENGYFKTEVLNTMQTPALFALKNQLFDGQIREEMIARLRENFKIHDNCLQTGFLGTSILMSTLTENGMVDIAYELLFQRKNPSWLYSVDNGATTVWERWNSYMIEKGMGPKGMNSFNHYAYGCVCEWIWETAAGISCTSANPGFSRIVLAPVPDKRLGFVDAEYDSAAGKIRSSWRYEGDTWVWEFTVPDGAVADVTLPGESESKEYVSGNYTVKL